MEKNWVMRKLYRRFFIITLGICIIHAFYAHKVEMNCGRKGRRNVIFFVGRLGGHFLVDMTREMRFQLICNASLNEWDEIGTAFSERSGDSP